MQKIKELLLKNNSKGLIWKTRRPFFCVPWKAWCVSKLDNPLSQNRYTYTENNPVNFADPSGHSIWGNIKNTVSKAVTTVKNTVTNAVNRLGNFANKVTNTVKAATHSVVNTVKNIFTPNTGNKNSYPLTAKSNFSSPGSYPAAEYASVFTNVGYTPAQKPTYTCLLYTSPSPRDTR